MDVRSLTLRSRSRRPQISAPRPIQDPNAAPPALPSLPSSPPRSSRQAPRPTESQPAFASTSRQQQNGGAGGGGGATSDLVKRRYSTRYNQLPAFDAPPVPGIPSLPSEFLSGDRPSGVSSGPIRLDVKALRDPKLPVDNCTLSSDCLTDMVHMLIPKV
jgi:hypothetical protein